MKLKKTAAVQMSNLKIERTTYGFGYKNVGSGYHYETYLCCTHAVFAGVYRPTALALYAFY